MSVAVHEIEHFSNGVDRKHFEASLQELENQIRFIDRKLVTKVEREITVRYKKQRNELALIRSSLS